MKRFIHNNPIATWLAKRRDAAHAQAFISMLRQAAALLSAGRSAHHVWAELAELHDPCTTDPADHDHSASRALRPNCCLHHVLAAQSARLMLNQPPFCDTTGPGNARYWQQLSGCIRLANEAGIPLAAILQRLADALDAGQDAQQARDAAAAGPKTTATLLAWLPVAGLGLSALLGTTIFDLLTEPIGWILAFTGLSLTLLGRYWSATLIRKAEQS